MEDKPLRSHRRSCKNRTPATPDERYIQQTFADFDFRQREIDALQRAELLKTSMEMEAEKLSQSSPGAISGASRLTLRDEGGEGPEEGEEEGEGNGEDDAGEGNGGEDGEEENGKEELDAVYGAVRRVRKSSRAE